MQMPTFFISLPLLHHAHHLANTHTSWTNANYPRPVPKFWRALRHNRDTVGERRSRACSCHVLSDETPQPSLRTYSRAKLPNMSRTSLYNVTPLSSAKVPRMRRKCSCAALRSTVDRSKLELGKVSSSDLLSLSAPSLPVRVKRLSERDLAGS
jgi:hypothetical protein